MSEQIEQDQTFHFDDQKQSWICPTHGEVDFTAWVNCWDMCQDGEIDAHDEDPLLFDPGDVIRCSTCRGAGGWRVCGYCNLDNEDAEF